VSDSAGDPKGVLCWSRQYLEHARTFNELAQVMAIPYCEAWGHGAFTEALIEGLSEGKADFLHNGSVSVSELDAYIAGRVKALTDGRQHPDMSRPDTVPDFAFATAR
jgi:hypothetical protein